MASEACIRSNPYWQVLSELFDVKKPKAMV